MFAEGKRLGPNGLNWLKVHLVNIHGQLKKSSLEERINYADQHLDQIFDSADQPFDVRGNFLIKSFLHARKKRCNSWLIF